MLFFLTFIHQKNPEKVLQVPKTLNSTTVSNTDDKSAY